MPRPTLLIALLALALGAAALVLELTRKPDVADRIVYVSHTADNDATDDKEARVSCPAGTILLSGGFAIQHGNESPAHSLAVYQGYVVNNGWDVQAHETRAAQEGRWPWDVTSVAVCLRR
jgi:hypothetical protein